MKRTNVVERAYCLALAGGASLAELANVLRGEGYTKQELRLLRSPRLVEELSVICRSSLKDR